MFILMVVCFFIAIILFFQGQKLQFTEVGRKKFFSIRCREALADEDVRSQANKLLGRYYKNIAMGAMLGSIVCLILTRLLAPAVFIIAFFVFLLILAYYNHRANLYSKQLYFQKHGEYLDD